MKLKDTVYISGGQIWTSANDGASSGLDADTLDGNQATAFAAASHTHDDRYFTETESDSRFLKLAGGTLTGQLNLHAGNYEGSIVFGSASTWRTGIRQHDDADAELRIWAKHSSGMIFLATGYDGEPADIARPTDGLAIQGNKLGIGDFSTADPAYKLHVKGDIYANGGWVRVSGNDGLYFETHGGGWRMTDSTWIRAYNDKNIYTGGKLEVGGSVRGDSGFMDDHKRFVTVGGGYSVGNASGTGGAIKIELPTAVNNNNTMMSMTVHVYEYSTGQSFTIRCGGYNYGNGNWYNEFAYMLNDSGKGGDVPVYFGNDGTRNIIWIGEPSWIWSYPNVFVTDFQAGHSQSESWKTGWRVSFDTAARTNVTASRTAFRLISWGNYSLLDARYYTESEVDTLLGTKAAASHTHDDRYYTESEVDTLLAGKLGSTAKAADSNLLDGLDLHTGRNNEANKVVRTDDSGYIQAGWINTTSGGRSPATRIDRVYASDDSYLRYYSLEDFKVAIGLPKNSFNRQADFSATAGYHTGVMGYSNTYDVFTRLPHFGSGFIEFWNEAANAPDNGHWVGLQSFHAVNWDGVAGRNYGWQMVHKGGTTGDIRFNAQWGDSDYGWINIWNSANDGAGSGLDADTLDGLQATAFAAASHTHAISDVTGLQTALDGKQAAGSYAAASHTHNVVVTQGNYVWSADTRAGDYTTGIQTSFVQAANGWPNYGAVLHVGARGGSDAGGDFQLYMGHGSNYGGTSLRVRSADNDAEVSDSWTEWKTILDSSNVGNYALTALPSHTHDDRYYTESEVDTLLAGKAASSHTHDDRYYTESEVDTLLAGKLGSTAKAADSELIDGIDSSRIVYGANSRKSTRNDSSMVSRAQEGGFFYGYNPGGAPYTEWWNWITIAGASWTSDNNYDFKLAHNFHGDDFYVSRMTNGTQYGWRKILDSSNIGSYAAAVSHTHDDRYYTESEVDTLLGTKAASSHTHDIGSITDASRWWNNFGGNHSTRTSFDAAGGTLSTGFGWRFVQGNTNGPGTDTSPNQFYALTVGLGSEYDYNTYGMQLAIPRNTASPYISVRFEENRVLGGWQKISAGYADSAGSVAWSNVSGKPTTFSPSSHTHDDRYYTESEVNSLLNDKGDAIPVTQDGEALGNLASIVVLQEEQRAEFTTTSGNKFSVVLVG